MSGNTDNPLRSLPAVDRLLNSDGGAALVSRYGRQPTLEALRAILESTRDRLRSGQTVSADETGLLQAADEHLRRATQPTLRPVINATGVIIHTNLGRAPLSLDAQQAIVAVAGGYSTLEYNLDSGKRGSRLIHAERLLCQITGAEAALVVNNNASALVLALSGLAKGREVIISRGQLVEIGGGFRVPEVMEQSGAKLVEVGTTNRTRAADYERAVTDETGLLMRAHASNFKQIGFTESAALAEMAEVAHRHHVHLLDDLGSGALLDTAAFGMDHEPTVQESIQVGADLVAFSGDKLLGGPQAGILIGKKTLIERLRRHPLARAIRADKLCLAALTATLDHYRKGEALEKVPVWWMIARRLADLEAIAQQWAAQTGGQVIPGESTVGGGSLPGATLPTALLALDVAHPDDFAAKLRAAETPVIARIADGRVLFDPRTVLPGQEAALLEIVEQVTLNAN
jgi:L-seryl-tRNA(Ser) seleniumtransferase